MTEDPLVAPQLPVAVDVAGLLTSSVASAIPIVGGGVAALLNGCFRAKHEADMQDFFEKVAVRVNRLTDDREDLAQRLQEPEFIEFGMRALRVAEVSSQEEKRAWLANALVNCLRPDPTENLDRFRNLRIIDQIMPIHVLVLRFLDEPSPWLTEWGTALPKNSDTTHDRVLTQTVPGLNDETYAAALLTDLHEMELVSNAGTTDFAAMFDAGISGTEYSEPYSLPEVTARAASLLAFIRETP